MSTLTPPLVTRAFSNPCAWRDFLSLHMGQFSSSLCISYPSTPMENPSSARADLAMESDLARDAPWLYHISVQYLLDGTSQNDISMTCLTSLRV